MNRDAINAAACSESCADAYYDALAEISATVRRLRAAVEEAADPPHESINWSHVGTLQSAASDLSTLVRRVECVAGVEL